MNAMTELLPHLWRIRASNSGPMTGTGTNTYLVGKTRCAIVDPGPALPGHVDAILAATRGREVAAVLITHTHRDHTEAARHIADMLKVPVLGAGRHGFYRELAPLEAHGLERAADWHHSPDRELAEGEDVGLDVPLRLVATPGHTLNHVSFAGQGYCLTGDHVMGWSSTIIAPPDGHMGDYLSSLEKLAMRPETLYLPGHGEVIEDGPARVRDLLSHRRTREAQILSILRADAGPQHVEDVACKAYPDLPAIYRMAGLLSAQAHLEHLVEQGLARQIESQSFQRT